MHDNVIKKSSLNNFFMLENNCKILPQTLTLHSLTQNLMPTRINRYENDERKHERRKK
jgi:hypothetical protein